MTPAFRALIDKEWRGLRPIAVLIAVLFIFGLFYAQASDFLDQYTLWEDYFDNLETSTVMNFIFCAIISLGLLVREKDEGTLMYLDGLPVRRSSIYLAKWLVAVFLGGIIDVMFFVECFIYDAFSRESDMPGRQWHSYGVYLGLHIFQTMFFVSLMFCLSFLRRWAFLIIGALFWAVFWMKSSQVPFAEWLDPFSLVQVPEKEDERWIIPWGHLGFLGAVGLGFWLVGLFTFTVRFDSIRQARGSCLAKGAGVLAIFLIVIVWMGFMITSAVMQEDELIEEAAAAAEETYTEKFTPQLSGGNAIATESSEKFQFIFREKSRKQVQPLVDKSDATFATVADFLKVDQDARDGRIVVDLSNPLGDHNAGRAHWQKIRMVPPGPKQPVAKGVAVLGHEITHVLIDQITDNRLTEDFGSVRWFHEGLASYVEFRFFEKPEARADYEHWIALASTWDEIDFAEVVDNTEFTELHDSFLVYPIGRLWVKAAVNVYGDDAPTKLLTAFARPDAPRNLDGLARWRDVCLAADFDLERIRSRFRTRLKELRDTHAEVCEKYTEITEASAIRDDGKIVISPELPENWDEVVKNLPEKSKLMCRVRPETDSEPAQWRYAKLNKKNEFRLSGFDFLKPQIGVQIGWETGGWTEMPVLGEWITVTVEAEKQ
ncbi:ABC transporter permease [Verrucomicrobiales bacterium]|nr:ABC transporter permease [Verrucomicrobiales bacterium]